MFGVRRHIIDDPFGGCWTLSWVGALGHSGVMLTDRGCVVWESGSRSEFVGFISCFSYKAALGKSFFTTTFTGNKYIYIYFLPYLSFGLFIYIFFLFPNLYVLLRGGVFPSPAAGD